MSANDIRAAARATLRGLPPCSDGRRVWAELGQAGLVSAAYRGGDPAAGVDPDGLGALLAELDDRFELGATLAVCVQLATTLPLLVGDSRIGTRMLAKALTGAQMTALAATDETPGSDLIGLTTEVMLNGPELRITGAKRWIANATNCDGLLVLARHRPSRHFTSFTWILVPATAPGVRIELADTDLFAGSGTGHVWLDDVRLPADHVVGRPGRGMASFATHIATERLAGALWGVALCRRVLADTKRHLQDRKVVDGPLWQLGAVRQRFAACLVLVRQLQAFTREVADAITLRQDIVSAAMLKAAVATVMSQVLAECAQFHGADGFRCGGIQRLRAQAALFGIGGGATEVMLSAVSESADAVIEELGA